MKNSKTLKDLQEESLSPEEQAYLYEFSVTCDHCGLQPNGIPELFNRDYFNPAETAPTCPRCDNVWCLTITKKPEELPTPKVYMKYASIRGCYPIPQFAPDSVFSTQGH